ncbi:MAG: ABC transporter permease [Anaerolineales bacterium]|nr:ABC transporter permease [Anaerolineales bacterium]
MQTILKPTINPIIVKELRSRMRGVRAFSTLTAVLLSMGFASYVLYRVVLTTGQYSATPLSPQIGQSLFFALALMLLLMVVTITPAVTASAISSEDEKQTFEMLMATPLSPASILWGKLVSSLSYIFLLIFAAIPMASLIFIFGGVAPRDMAKALLVIVSVAVTLGVFSLFMSTWLKRTGRATVLSFLVVAILLFGTIFIFAASGILRQAEPPRWMLVANPMSALFSTLSPSLASNYGGMGFVQGFAWLLGGNMQFLTGSAISQTGIPRPLYHYTLPLYGFITLVLYMFSTRLIRPTRRWSLHWKESLTMAGILAAFIGIVGIAFWSTSDRYEHFTNIFRSPSGDGLIMGPQPAVVMERAVPMVDIPPVQEALSSTESFTPVDQIDEAEVDAIYAAVVRRIYQTDHNLNSAPIDISIIYLVTETDDSVGDPVVPIEPSRRFDQGARGSIVAFLEDLAIEILWVDKQSSDVFINIDTGEVIGGLIITLGNPHLYADGSILVSASLTVPGQAATGKSYLVGLVDDDWVVVGDTGMEWSR